MIILDRIEGGVAVLEIDGDIKEVPVEMLLGEVHEGAVLKAVGGGYEVDMEATVERKNKILALQKKLHK